MVASGVGYGRDRMSRRKSRVKVTASTSVRLEATRREYTDPTVDADDLADFLREYASHTPGERIYLTGYSLAAVRSKDVSE